MNYCTAITNYEKENQILSFLEDFPKNEVVNNMILQMRYIMEDMSSRDYYLSFNPHNMTLFSVGGIDKDWATGVNMTMFLATIEKTINALKTTEKTMRQLTLENYKTLTENEVIIVYQNKDSILPVKPLMMMTTSVPAHYDPNAFLYYEFTNLSNPLISDRVFRSGNKMDSIRAAIESGMEVYVAESINKIFFSGENGQQPIETKPQQITENTNHIAQIESYVENLIRKHTEYLITELGMTQYPKNTYRETTEIFIIEKLK